MHYLFGPVNSRRLGLSQGIDLLPAKVCSLNCIYCEVGATEVLTCDRREYAPTADIIAEIDHHLSHPAAAAVDVYTVTASGEPTLHLDIGKIIRHLKARTAKPVALLTNGTLLHHHEVRRELMTADIVVPSLDAALPESYQRINRPAGCAHLPDLLEGLISFREEFRGRLWLEILVVSGLNDTPAEVEALARAVRRINPEKVQLNTVVRPPLEAHAFPASAEKMQEIAGRLPGSVEIVVDFAKRERRNYRPVLEDEILYMLRRRPCTIPDICEALNLAVQPATDCIAGLVRAHAIHKTRHDGKEYYQTSKAKPAETGNARPIASDAPCQENPNERRQSNRKRCKQSTPAR